MDSGAWLGVAGPNIQALSADCLPRDAAGVAPVMSGAVCPSSFDRCFSQRWRQQIVLLSLANPDA